MQRNTVSYMLVTHTFREDNVARQTFPKQLGAAPASVMAIGQPHDSPTGSVQLQYLLFGIYEANGGRRA